MKKIEFSKWPIYETSEIDEVCKVLKSGKVNYWTGNQTKTFENEFADLIGSTNAIALANGSLALSAAYKSIGLSYGDELITTPRTFIATSSTAADLGVKLIFADICRDSGCLTAENIEPLITKKTRAISLVHLGGWPADMESIMDLSRHYKIPVVEDCSQAHGAKIKNKSVGSFGLISTWSFCQDKIISTGGEGGMITTSDPKIWDFIWSYKDHGKSFIKMHKKIKNQIGFRWMHDEIGTNMRLTEMQSVIGRSQIRKLKEWNLKRKINAYLFIDSLNSSNILRIPTPSKNITHAWYRFYAYIKPHRLKTDWNRDRIIKEIKDLGVSIFTGSCSEIYLEKCLRKYENKNLNANSKRLPIAKELGETSLCFLVHPNLRQDEIEYQIKIIKEVLNRASL